MFCRKGALVVVQKELWVGERGRLQAGKVIDRLSCNNPEMRSFEDQIMAIATHISQYLLGCSDALDQ